MKNIVTKTTVFISLLLSILYFRTFIWLINSWLTDPYYSHGFLIPIICGFIAWRNIRETKNENEKGREQKLNPETDPEPFKFKPGIYLFAFGLTLYVIGFIKIFPFLSALSFLFTASGLILYFYGKPLMRSFLFPISFFIFAIPLPFTFLDKVAYSLQSLSAYTIPRYLSKCSESRLQGLEQRYNSKMLLSSSGCHAAA